MKVWWFQSHRTECPQRGIHGSRKTMEIVAAPTEKAAAKAFGTSAYDFGQYGGLSSVQEEKEVALTEPGAVFWRPLILPAPGEPKDEWTRSK